MLIPFYHTFAPTKPSDTEANLNVTDVRRHIRFYSPFFIDGIRSWTAQTIWSALFLLGMALTIKDIVEQVVLYLGQPTSTLTRVVFNDSIQFIEDVTFCVEIDTVRMNFIDQQRYVDGKEAREILNQFEQNPDILQFLGNLSNFDDQPARKFVALTTKMLANVLQLESYVNSNLSDYSIGLWGRASYPRHPEMYESLGSAYQFFYNRRISLSALKSAIGRLLCLQMRSSLLIFKDKKNGQSALENFDICDPQWLTWLGKCPFDEAADQLCFRYPKEMSLMKSLNDYIVLIVEPQALYNDANEMVKSKANYAYVNFAGDRAVSDSNNDIQISLQRQANALLQLSGHYKAVSTVEHPCTDEKSYFDCRGGCRARKIGEFCRCWPISWDALQDKPTDIPFCGSGLMSQGIVPQIGEFSCLANTSVIYDIDLSCRQGCLRKCEVMMIATTLSDCFECDDLSGLQDNVTILNMTFNRFEHPVFEESITMDWTTLTVNIGGIFALWLGMSVMSIFDFCYYLFRVARHYVRKLISKRRMKTSRIESNISMTALDNYNNNYEKSDSISSRSNSVAIDNPSAAISEKIYQRAMEILSSTGLSPLESETFLKSPTGHLALLAADQNDDKNLFFMILSCFGSLQKQLRELQAERLPVKTEPQLEKDSESINQHR